MKGLSLTNHFSHKDDNINRTGNERFVTHQPLLPQWWQYKQNWQCKVCYSPTASPTIKQIQRPLAMRSLFLARRSKRLASFSVPWQCWAVNDRDNLSVACVYDINGLLEYWLWKHSQFTALSHLIIIFFGNTSISVHETGLPAPCQDVVVSSDEESPGPDSSAVDLYTPTQHTSS